MTVNKMAEFDDTQKTMYVLALMERSYDKWRLKKSIHNARKRLQKLQETPSSKRIRKLP